MKTEQEIRAQLAEVQAAIDEYRQKLAAAYNQEHALLFVLGELPETPQAEGDADGSDGAS